MMHWSRNSYMVREVLILFGVLVVAGINPLIATANAEDPQGRKAEWLQLRGDRHMSGRSAGIGYIVDGPPHESWRFDIAAWESYFSVDPQRPANLLELPFETPVDPGYLQERSIDWGLGAPRLDLEGGGTPLAVPIDHHSKVAKILAAVAGLQKFEMENSFSDGGVAPKKGRLLAYDTGVERTVWETESFDDVWDPNVISTSLWPRPTPPEDLSTSRPMP
jgi:hypothetical protein